MDIMVNGEDIALEIGSAESVGEVLARVDELLEKAGSIIVGLSLDGKPLDADSFQTERDRPAAEVGRVEIVAESAAAVRAKALSTLLDLLALAREAAMENRNENWTSLQGSAQELEEAFSGLFSADELSFVRDLATLLDKAAAAAPDERLRADIALRCEGLEIFARERLSEIENPAAEMRKAALLYRSQAGELAELPVLLQTGKDERAMKAILLFIETFNKVIRLLPELKRRGFDTETLKIEGLALSEFYAAFNVVLRELAQSFEDRDAVRIGDLVEYEVAPRMASFFASIEEALGTP